jgi:aminopeptidase N
VFYFPEDSANAAAVREGVLRSMRFFSDWFGPAEEAPRFSVIEIPDGWGSQKDVTCILQTAAAFRDRSRLDEVYHEVSHLWNVECRDPFPPRIEEGLATYLEDVAAEHLEGGDRVRRSHERIAAWLRDLVEREPRYRELAMCDYGEKGDTDLSYWVGFLMFEVLHALVGDRAFGEIIGGFRHRHRDRGATTAEFIAFAKQRSPVDLDAFFVDWYATTRWQRLLAGDATLASMVVAYRPAERKP